MQTLPRYDELRRAINSLEWDDLFILYYHRAASEDLRLAREINGLCAGLIAVIEERKHFINELDILVHIFIPAWLRFTFWWTGLLPRLQMDSYPDNDDYDPYDDDMYENHDMSEHLQSICDDLDITIRSRKKK
nr:hypothetical protein [Tanacetum cinerariifolium]